MSFPKWDQHTVDKVAAQYMVTCLQAAPFAPTDFVKWRCTSKSHEWTASAIELQIDGGCPLCNDLSIQLSANGRFNQSMSYTLAAIVTDFQQGKLEPHKYHPDSEYHLILASFFFSAVRFEYLLLELCGRHTSVGTKDLQGEEFNMPALVDHLYGVTHKNVHLFSVPGKTTVEVSKKYQSLRDTVRVYTIARNKVAHGFSKHPLSGTKKYNKEISDLLKSFGAGKLNDVYENTSNFLGLSDIFIDSARATSKGTQRILMDLLK